MNKVEVQFSTVNKKYGQVEIGQVRNINYDIKQQAYAAYAEARETMSPGEALQAVRVFVLSRFFGIMEVLCHNEKINDTELREIMGKRILDFAKIIDLDEKRFEQVKKSKEIQEKRKKEKSMINKISISLKK